MREIKHIEINKGMKVSELVEGMRDAGFGARKIGEACSVMKEMFEDKECKVFLGVAGAMVPGGMKEIILDILDETDVFVTTGANLTHDLIEALGEKHYRGDELADDKKLNEQGIDRIYNVLMKNKVYEKLEKFFEDNFDKFKECKSIKEFLWKIGGALSEAQSPSQNLPAHSRSQIDNASKSTLSDFSANNKINEKNFLLTKSKRSDFTGSVAEQLISSASARDKINSKKSILQTCYEKKIPIFCPGIADSGIGLMMWGASNIKKILQSPTDLSVRHSNQGRVVNGKKQTSIDVFSDLNDIIDISWTSKKTGVIYVGGGLPKNFIQQALQFSKGADYGIQITTDRQEPGGSSGAPLREGISWGKLKSEAKFVDVFCDATIALPLIWASVLTLKK